MCPRLRAVTESAVTAAATVIPERGVSKALRQQAQVLDLASLPLHSVTLGKLLSLSEPLFSAINCRWYVLVSVLIAHCV